VSSRGPLEFGSPNRSHVAVMMMMMVVVMVMVAMHVVRLRGERGGDDAEDERGGEKNFLDHYGVPELGEPSAARTRTNCPFSNECDMNQRVNR